MVLISNNSINRLLIEENYKEFIKSLDQNPDFATFCYNLGYSILNSSVSNKDSISEARTVYPEIFSKQILERGLEKQDFYESQNLILLPQTKKVMSDLSTILMNGGENILTVDSPLPKSYSETNKNCIFEICITIKENINSNYIFRLAIAMATGAFALIKLVSTFKMPISFMDTVESSISMTNSGLTICDAMKSRSKSKASINLYMERILYNFNVLSGNKFIYAFDINKTYHNPNYKTSSIYLGIYAYYNKNYYPHSYSNKLFKIKK